MIAVALKGLAGRKVRALLTAFAIVIGVSMVSGTFILTDTMRASFDGLFTASADKTDAVISGKEVVKDSTSGSGVTIPESMLAKVRALPEVAAAGGQISPEESNVADVIGRDGKKSAMESVGGSIDPANARFSPLELKAGAWPTGSQQVAIDAGTAAKEHYKVGDAVVISTLGKRHTYRLSGTVSFGGVDSLGFARAASTASRSPRTRAPPSRS
jgi:putative ABC transport system permease protein